MCAPTVNSYKRLASSASASGTTWSPVWKAYGDNNRTCVVRTVAGRMEWRLPDPSCNVYAALAGTLLAGLDGIDRGMVPPQPCEQDLYAVAAAGGALPAQLPRSLQEALDALAADGDLTASMGQAFADQFLAVERARVGRFSPAGQCLGDGALRRVLLIFYQALYHLCIVNFSDSGFRRLAISYGVN